MGHVYRRTPRPKCAFNKVAKQLRHGCSSVNLLHYFRTSVPKSTSGGAASDSREISFAKDVLLNRVEHKCMCYCHNLAINGCF